MYINLIKVLIILSAIIILFLSLRYYINEFFTDKNNIKNNYKNFSNNIDKFVNKKKYVLIFSGGPSLRNFKKSDIPKKVWDNCHIISVKNAINFLHDKGIKSNFLLTNFGGAWGRINHKKIHKDTITIGLNIFNKINLDNIDHMINLNWNKNSMKLVKENKKGLEFTIKDNTMTTNWGHIMMELAIPLSIYLKPKKIITIGWDVKNQKKYWDTAKELFSSWSHEDTIINEFSCYLHDYMKKHYNIEIFKINKDSGIRIPLFDKNKHF